MKTGFWARTFASCLALFCCLSVYGQSNPATNQWNVLSPGGLLDRLGVVPNSPVLVKSLGDAAEYVTRWQLPANEEGWARRRPEVERALRKAIGLEKMPDRTPLNPRTIARYDFGDYTLETMVFESRPGFLIPANIYRPKPLGSVRQAAILSPIGHFLGAGKAAGQVQARCIGLAKLGFVVMSYDAIGHGERNATGNVHHEAGYALLPLGETIAGWMVWDSMRAIDYLQSLQEVDPDRIGVTGNSGGGLNTLYTAALDARVKACAMAGFCCEFNTWLKYGGIHCSCVHLPGLFRSMEWFEVAGLIAPRAALILQGEKDMIFPVTGARKAGRATEALYKMLGRPEQARFDEVPSQGHGYYQPYRERMYGWMSLHLLGKGEGQPIPEGELQLLDEKDPRLLCDPDHAFIPKSPTVVELARAKALELLSRRKNEATEADSAKRRQWVKELVAAGPSGSNYLSPVIVQKRSVPGGTVEKLSFISEDGQYIPGLFWLPVNTNEQARVVVIADEGGKAAVAESGLVRPLLEAGFAVFAIDLRGRGETLGHVAPRFNTNFRLVANQVLLGQPLAGRRAFDLLRAVDYLGLRPEVSTNSVTVVGFGNDALPAMLAAIADTRIAQVAVSGYFHSFISQIAARDPAKASLPMQWNDPQLDGIISTGAYDVDFGSVMPGALLVADIYDLARLIAPRRLLFSAARDLQEPGMGPLVNRFKAIAEASGETWLLYTPDRPLGSQNLLQWLNKS